MPGRRAAVAAPLAALVAATLFGTLGPLSRFAADAGVEGPAFVAWRAGIGAVALAFVLGATGGLVALRGGYRRLDRRGRTAFAVGASMGLVLNVCIFVAFGRITIALALMLFYVYPALVAAAGVLLGRDRLDPPKLTALLLASAGVVLVLAGSLAAGEAVTVDLLGVALGLAAAVAQTVFIVVSRSGFAGVPAAGATLVVLVVATVGAAAFALLVGAGDSLVAPLVSPEPWPFVLAAGILGAAVPSFLFLSSIQRMGGTRTGILMLWEPVVGVVLAAAWLGEALLPVQLVGGVLVLGAALLLQVASDPASEPVAGPVDLV